MFLKIDGKENNYNFTLMKFPYLDLCDGMLKKLILKKMSPKHEIYPLSKDLHVSRLHLKLNEHDKKLFLFSSSYTLITKVQVTLNI